MIKHLFTLLLTTSWVFPQSFSKIGKYESELIWIALFALGVISVIMMYILSQQRQKITNQYKKILRSRKDLEKTQTRFLDDIQEEMDKLRRNIAQTKLADEILYTEEEREKNVDSKRKLLDSTEALIGYLKLKSESIQIQNQSFYVNNMLHELSGTLATEFQNYDVEFIYDMNHSVPKIMVGDAVHIGQVLISILRYCIQQDPAGEVKLEMSLFNTYDSEYEIQFTITDTSKGLNNQDIKTLFIPEYDEKLNEYKKLDFFVAKKLVTLMNGDLIVHNTEGKGNLFIVTFPFNSAAMTEKRKYRLPEKTLTGKKVLIVDDRYQASLATKKMFDYFKHVTSIIPSESFMENVPNMAEYDIVVLNEKLFELPVISYLERIKEDQDIHVVASKSIFKQSVFKNTGGVIDQYLNKPFTQEQVYDVLIALHQIEKKKANLHQYSNKSISSDENDNKHKDSFVETPNITIDSFRDFSGSRVLVVEDNVINQKVLQNILSRANIHLKVVNNGQEAVEVLNTNEEKFDIVLMDINMPVLDGYEATKQIREKYTLDDLSIVALSALVLESEIKKMFESGVNGYLQKPLNIAMLYTAFDTFIDVNSISSDIVYPMVGNIEGINIEQGITYANENIALYKEVLDAFVSAYGDSHIVMESLAKDGKYDQMQELCLDMKGLTGTIGAYDMNDLLDRMHKSLVAKNYQFIPELVDKYKREFPRLSSAIKHYIR